MFLDIHQIHFFDISEKISLPEASGQASVSSQTAGPKSSKFAPYLNLKKLFFSDFLQNQVLRGQINQKLHKNIFSGIWACFQTQTNLTSWWIGRQFLWVPPLTYAQEFIVSLQGSSKIQSRPQASPMQQMIQKFFWELPSLFPVDLKVFSNFWHSL